MAKYTATEKMVIAAILLAMGASVAVGVLLIIHIL